MTYTRAGFGIRLLGYLIDSLIVYTLTSLLTSLFPTRTVAVLHLSFEQPVLAATLASLILTVLYYAIFYSSKLEATPGKYIVGLKVLTVDGQRLSFFRGLARAVVQPLSLLILGIGYLLIVIREDNRALHDLIVKTSVVYRNK